MVEKICIVGLGYVGMPLALEFGKKCSTIGYDKNIKRVKELKKNFDSNNEITKSEFFKSKKLFFTYDINDIKDCTFYIIAVPTPVNKRNLPDLTLLKKACRDIGSILKKNDTIVFESTVYPGVTEEICLPLIEQLSGLKQKNDFSIGYSPERINPGDKKHSLTKVTKIISGIDDKSTIKIKKTYEKILKKIYVAQSIKVAEGAKIIENIQRDLNIALVNEFSIIFDRLKIDTKNVLDAAATKWNFINFTPGLVGGHCIGVDPYYLSFIAKKKGYKNKIIISGRGINNFMPKFIVNKFTNFYKKNVINNKKKKILVLGLTFKENCRDIRNSKVFELIKFLKNKNFHVDVTDPLLNKNDLYNYLQKINFKSYKSINFFNYNAIILAVSHEKFKNINLKKIKAKKILIFDIKSFFPREFVDGRI